MGQPESEALCLCHTKRHAVKAQVPHCESTGPSVAHRSVRGWGGFPHTRPRISKHARAHPVSNCEPREARPALQA